MEYFFIPSGSGFFYKILTWRNLNAENIVAGRFKGDWVLSTDVPVRFIRTTFITVLS